MHTRMLFVLACLAGAGCATPRPPQLSPELMESARAAMANSRYDAFPRIAAGETLEAPGVAAIHHFTAKAGDVVTVTVRSRGGETGLNLIHTANIFSEDGNRPSIGMDMKLADFLFDINGPHSELVATLPEDADGIYLIQITNPENAASLTLSSGSVPADDIVQLVRPRPDNAGQYLFPLKSDGSLAEWVTRSGSSTKNLSLGGSLGRAAARAAGHSGDVAGLVGIAGEAVGKAIAIESIGGWDFIRHSSNQSFDTLKDMARYLHYRYAKDPRYGQMISAASVIYHPDFEHEMALVKQGR